MKASELMMGDWVVWATRSTKIDGIAEGGFSVHLKDKGWQSVDALEPIPLTPEILEKNEIRLLEVGDNGVTTPAKYRNRYEKWQIHTQWKDTYLWYDRTTKYWNLHDMNGAQFTFVHEFQHALRLCGIEKEIEL